MLVEECCQALLAYYLPRIDKGRRGICIDVGVGTFAFYCRLFARLGYETIAVEPLPVDRLRQLCRDYNIALIENCLSDIDGFQTIYLGAYGDSENLNLSSLSPEWWGASTKTRQVRAMTLTTLLSSTSVQRITCLKLDIEGMEPIVIRQLRKLPENLLPSVITFEYGGGNNRESGKGGWSTKDLDGTLECLRILKQCDYRLAIVVDSAANTTERLLNLQSLNMEPDDIFYPQAVYGNIISFRGVHLAEDEVSEICVAYRDNDSPAPKLELPSSYLQRFFRRINAFIQI